MVTKHHEELNKPNNQEPSNNQFVLNQTEKSHTIRAPTLSNLIGALLVTAVLHLLF